MEVGVEVMVTGTLVEVVMVEEVLEAVVVEAVLVEVVDASMPRTAAELKGLPDLGMTSPST